MKIMQVVDLQIVLKLLQKNNYLKEKPKQNPLEYGLLLDKNSSAFSF